MRQPLAEVVLVTGCSSGIGGMVCDRLARRGTSVYGASRSLCAPEQWTYLRLDVTDATSVRGVVEEVLRREGRIDALVNCAGVGLAGALEDTADDEAMRHFDTNFFGTTRMLRAVLPAMRRQARGRIIVIGSIGGLIGLPYVGYYSAAKFALDGLVEALRNEVAPFGIQATIVHPGDLDTAFTANRVVARQSRSASAYADAFRDTLAFYAAQEKNAPKPDAVARLIERLLRRRALPGRVVVGSPLERLGVLGKSILPGRSFQYLFRKAYGT
jgi:NAD(P)-dependent dehydrogenase (short-subunit alcohol dehydrogenase family)